jgi:hypothetical protein
MRAFYLATIVAASILCSVRPVLGQCANFNEFTAMSAPLNEACCEGAGTDCTMGIPSSCPGDCATVLLPMRTECGDFLKGDGAMFKDLIDSAATQCAAAPSTGTCPCLNGECADAALTLCLTFSHCCTLPMQGGSVVRRARASADQGFRGNSASWRPSLLLALAASRPCRSLRRLSRAS